MKTILLDAGRPATCEPLTCTRPLAACPVANRPLGEWQAERLQAFGRVPDVAGMALHVRGQAWLSTALIGKLGAVGGAVVVKDSAGGVLAWIGTGAESPAGATTLVADEGCVMVRYPWDLLRVNELILGNLVQNDIRGEVSPAAHIEGHLVLGAGSRILPGVFIEGNVIVGRDCKIGPNCYLRGSTSIGDNCHIGQAVEIKNSIVMAGVGIGHLSYCGDSIIGEGVNFGAGTITANFRHDGRNHRSLVAGKLVDTGRRKFGTIMGDRVHTGIHTSIYPGRKIWPDLSTRPGAIVATDMTGAA